MGIQFRSWEARYGMWISIRKGGGLNAAIENSGEACDSLGSIRINSRRCDFRDIRFAARRKGGLGRPGEVEQNPREG